MTAFGIAYRITQQPQAYETAWFRGSAVLAITLLLASAYRLRLRQIADQLNLRLEERVNERTRIARDLHDTLLQSFHGLMLRFQAVQNMLPEQPVEARHSLQIAMDRAAEAITEGRCSDRPLTPRLAQNLSFGAAACSVEPRDVARAACCRGAVRRCSSRET